MGCDHWTEPSAAATRLWWSASYVKVPSWVRLRGPWRRASPTSWYCCWINLWKMETYCIRWADGEKGKKYRDINNSLVPGKFEWDFIYVIFKRILMIDVWGISCEIALIWMSLDLTYVQSTLIQVMAWCRQATSHYLNQWWPRSLSPYGITRLQWDKGCKLIVLWKKYIWNINISMSLCKKDVTPVHYQWSYVFLALTHWYGMRVNFSI